MTLKNKELLEEIAGASGGLAIDMVQKANSGHPGAPLGMRDMNAYLWYEFMRYNPANPNWLNRDRFVLSAGHASAALYSMLHLSGYDVTIEDIKQFRQLDSNTPGHPEAHETPGVETTTGPLGQGFANAVGMALGMKILGDRYNAPDHEIVNPKVICMVGDGCMMEGISHESLSIAGHLKLDNLIVIYDYNNITLDDDLSASCSDDAVMRCKAHSWDVHVIEDGHDFDQIDHVMRPLRGKQGRPVMVINKTVIGRSSLKAGSHTSHGSPLGEDNVKATKEVMGLPKDEIFYVLGTVREAFEMKQKEMQRLEDDWNKRLADWREAYPQKSKMFDRMDEQRIDPELKEELRNLEFPDSIAGRKVHNSCLKAAMERCEWLVGGSADLSGSDCTMVKEKGIVNTGSFSGSIFKFGIREFAMAGILNGLTLDHLRGFGGTFFTFYDYNKNAIRLAALSGFPTINVFTHDSIFLGEDGPTHQSIEHMAAVRAVPNLIDFRPADEFEVKATYWWVLNQTKHPVVMVLTRQNLPRLKGSDGDFDETVGRGGYVLRPEKPGKIDVTLFSTGSEVHLAEEVAERLIGQGKNVRVVSIPSWGIFEMQPKDYQNDVAGGDLGLRVSIEAQSPLGWERFVGRDGLIIGMETFGKSAPAADLAERFGFTAEQILERINSMGRPQIQSNAG